MDQLHLARALIDQKRWFEAKQILVEILALNPGQVNTRLALARVWLALGQPQHVLELLEPCLVQGVHSPAIDSCFWLAKVRSADDQVQATRCVQAARQQCQQLPTSVMEEWRLITKGLIKAGWQKEAELWLAALGSEADGLNLKPFWDEWKPQANDPELDLDQLSAHMVLHPAGQLKTKAATFNQQISQTWLDQLPAQLPARPGPRRRWLLCGDENLKQCWLYRVEQKANQLTALGCQVELITLQALKACRSIPDLLDNIHGVLIHRLPASPVLFSVIAESRRQGILTVMDLDDLLFDPAHSPPPLANYAGSIPPELHRAWSVCHPQLQASLEAADHRLFSTNTLADHWTALHQDRSRADQSAQIWPNLIPDILFRAKREPRRRWRRQISGQLRLIIASASQPHLLAWHQQMVPALVQLMTQHDHLRLDLLGILTLPLVLEPFAKRIRCRGSCNFPEYLHRLGEADIGLMVLEPGPFTDAKSPNRWMECSLMGVATVLSPIQSCRDLLSEGEHTLFAQTTDEWVNQINRLIRNPDQRLALAQRAYQHALNQLGPDQAKQLWDPLLRLDHPAPHDSIALVCDTDQPNALHGEGRLANALVESLRQSTTRRVDWITPLHQKRIEAWRDTPPDVVHITGTGAHCQDALALASDLGVPCILHLHNRAWLKPPAAKHLKKASLCTATSSRLTEATQASQQQAAQLLHWPWQPIPCQRNRVDQGLVRALVMCAADHSTGLITLKQAIETLTTNKLDLTVLDTGQSDPPPGQEQTWGHCRVSWEKATDRKRLRALLSSHDLWIEPTLSSDDDPALACEVLSAGLWMLATDISAASEVMDPGQNGALLPSQNPSGWSQQLEDVLEHHPRAQPRLSFPGTEPRFNDVIEQLHRHIQA